MLWANLLLNREPAMRLPSDFDAYSKCGRHTRELFGGCQSEIVGSRICSRRHFDFSDELLSSEGTRKNGFDTRLPPQLVLPVPSRVVYSLGGGFSADGYLPYSMMTSTLSTVMPASSPGGLSSSETAKTLRPLRGRTSARSNSSTCAL